MTFPCTNSVSSLPRGTKLTVDGRPATFHFMQISNSSWCVYCTYDDVPILNAYVVLPPWAWINKTENGYVVDRSVPGEICLACKTRAQGAHWIPCSSQRSLAVGVKEPLSVNLSINKVTQNQRYRFNFGTLKRAMRKVFYNLVKFRVQLRANHLNIGNEHSSLSYHTLWPFFSHWTRISFWTLEYNDAAKKFFGAFAQVNVIHYE